MEIMDAHRPANKKEKSRNSDTADNFSKSRNTEICICPICVAICRNRIFLTHTIVAKRNCRFESTIRTGVLTFNNVITSHYDNIVIKYILFNIVQ